MLVLSGLEVSAAGLAVVLAFMMEAMTLWTAANSGSRQKRAPLLSVTTISTLSQNVVAG